MYNEKDFFELIKTKGIDNVIENLNQDLKKKPHSYDVYLCLGISYSIKNNYEKAIEYLNNAIEINPNKPDAYAELGTIYNEKGEYDKAIEYLELSIELDLNNSYTYVELSIVYMKKKDYCKSIKYLNQSININPNNDNAYYWLGVIYYKKEEYSNAIIHLNKSIKINSDNYKAYLFLGFVYLKKGFNNKAIEYLTKARDIKENDFTTYNFIGMAYYQKGKYDIAIEYLTKAINLNERNSDLYNGLGLIYLKKGKYNKAIEYLTKAIKVNSQDDGSYFLLGKVYKAKKDYYKAIEYLNKSIQLDKTNDKNNKEHLLLLLYIIEEKYNKALEISLKNKSSLIYSLTNSLKNIFKLETEIPLEYKKLLFKIYYLWNSLKINDVDSVKKGKNNYLYQYRNFDFLEIILKNKKLWLNPTDYQNDPNEGKAFLKYIGHKNNKEINTDLIAFISCFSALKDDLIMWNSSYAENGKGISIGIDINKISTEIETFLSGINILPSSLIKQDVEENKEKKEIPMKEIGLYKILYINLEKENETKKVDKDKIILKEIKSSYETIIKNKVYKHRKQEVDNWLNDLFTLIRYLIKFDDYEHEKEYRLLYINDIKSSQHVKPSTCWNGVHIETEKVLFNNEEMPERVFIGPKNNSTIKKLKLKHYLKCAKLDRYIEVKSSCIEFR